MFIEKEAIELKVGPLSYNEGLKNLKQFLLTIENMMNNHEINKVYANMMLIERDNFIKYCEQKLNKYEEQYAVNYLTFKRIINAYDETVLTIEALEHNKSFIMFMLLFVSQINKFWEMDTVTE